MTGHRSTLGALAAVGWRALAIYVLVAYLWRSLVILAALVALAAVVVTAAGAAAVAAVRALLFRRRGW